MDKHTNQFEQNHLLHQQSKGLTIINIKLIFIRKLYRVIPMGLKYKPTCIVYQEILQDMFWFMNSYILLVVRDVYTNMLQGFREMDQRQLGRC